MLEIDIYYLKQQKTVIHKNLLSIHEKNPQPVMTMLTKKRVREMFPFMEEIEYKVRGID